MRNTHIYKHKGHNQAAIVCPSATACGTRGKTTSHDDIDGDCDDHVHDDDGGQDGEDGGGGDGGGGEDEEEEEKTTTMPMLAFILFHPTSGADNDVTSTTSS